jgi:hypothetical protein
MKKYHPTLVIILEKWIKFKNMKKEYLNFILHIAVLHEDKTLTRWAIEKGADINAPVEKWYAIFLKNYLPQNDLPQNDLSQNDLSQNAY